MQSDYEGYVKLMPLQCRHKGVNQAHITMWKEFCRNQTAQSAKL